MIDMAEITRRELMLAAGQAVALAGATVSLDARAAAATNANVAFDPATHVHPELCASVPELPRCSRLLLAIAARYL